MKKCNSCHELKLKSHFHKNKNHKDGRDYYCKTCRKRIYKEKNYYERKTNDDIIYRGFLRPPKPLTEKLGVQGKECNRCNEWKPLTEYHKFARLAYGLNIYCKDCDREAKRKYFHTEKGKNNSHRASHKRRTLLKKSKYMPFDRTKILRRDKYTCQFCGIKVHDRSTGNWNTSNKAHLDHIVPLVEGGETKEENLQVLCRSCNLSKGANKQGETQLTLF